MTTSVFEFIWKHISKLKWWFLGLLGLTISALLCYRASLYYISKIADLLASGQSKESIFSQSMIIIGIVAVFSLLNRFAFDGCLVLEAKFLPAYLSRLYKDLFNYAHRHSTAFFAEEMAGNVASKIRTIVDDAYEMYNNIFWGFIFTSCSLITTFIFIWSVNIEFAVGVMAFNVVYIYFIYLISRSISPYSETRARSMSETQGVLVDSISNASLVKGFSNFLYEKKRFFGFLKKAANAERREIKKFALLFFSQGLFRIILQCVFAAFPVYCWYKGEITIGDFVLLQTLVLSMNDVYFGFSQQFMKFFRLHGGIQDGLKLLSKPYDVVDASNAKELKVKRGEIKINKMLYHYKGSDALFKDFNLEVEAGQKIGLVGHSGSGKSTLVKLISRLYDIQNGSIKIDGQDISKVTQDSLRQNIALIPQDPSLFNRTIMENIRYGNLRATDVEVFEAAKKAHIHDFIMSLKDGYDSKVGERGVMLSGGERQRIAIARAILKNAPILILDEATSALDSASEKYIQDSMKELMSGKTVIAIAHRLSTLKEMDTVVVMDKGEIKETGSHTSLLRKKGLYHSFYEMQSQGFLQL